MVLLAALCAMPLAVRPALAVDLDTELLTATHTGTPAAVEALIAQGANVNAKDPVLGWTPLHVAAMYRCYNNMQKLLDHGANVNAADAKGNTPLILAVDSVIVSRDGQPLDPDPDVIVMLLSKHPDLDVRNAAGRSAIMVAMEDHRVQIVRLLRKAGASEADTAGSAFIGAIRDGDVGAVKELLKQGVKPDTADRSGRTGLMIAADVGADDVASTLLSLHANVNAMDREETTALMFAVRHSHEAIVKLLLDSGADANIARKATKETPAHIAAGDRNPNILRMLLEKGARVNVADNYGVTPLMRAAMGAVLDFTLNTTGRIALPINVKMLLDHGADVAATDAAGDTALSFAMQVRTNPSYPSDATPDDIAKINSALALVVSILRNAGAH
jgi:ankyrin repeat protein